MATYTITKQDVTERAMRAIKKFRDEYTDGSDAAVRDIPIEMRAEGRTQWAERMKRELMEAFPDAHPDEVEGDLSDLYSAVQEGVSLI